MHAQTSHHQIVIVGGGSGGLTVAARLKHALRRPDIAIVEPSRTHYYQPLWTLVGAGIVNKEVTARPEADYIPGGCIGSRITRQSYALLNIPSSPGAARLSVTTTW